MPPRPQCIFLADILLMLIAITTSYGLTDIRAPTCWTPDNENGFCIPITSCHRITWLLMNSGNAPPQYVNDFVRRSHCGNNGNTHFVCCSPQYIRRAPTQHTHPSHHYMATQQYPHPQHYTNTQHYPPLVQNLPRLQYPHQHSRTPQFPPPPPLYNPQSSPDNTFAVPLRSPHHNGQHLNVPFASTPNVRFPENLDQPIIPVGRQILNSIPCGTVSGDRIANGEKARLSEYPWMALLEFSGTQSNNRFLCGGSLITERYILTAAHCVANRNDLIGVRLGEHDLDTQTDCELGSTKRNRKCAPPVENIGIEQITPHPQYSARPLINDIALIRLDRNVQFKAHIKPICLPRAHQMDNYVPARVIISGWGITERGFASDELMKAEIPVRENSFCQNIYQRSVITPNHICAGGELRKSTCRGDSGSPMFAVVDLGWPQIHYIQFGIVSAGDAGCGSRHNYPSVYTRISTYIDWITSILQP